MLTTWSCSLLEKTEFKQRTLARAHSVELVESDLVGLIPENTSFEDSVKIVQEYIDQWIRKQVVLEQAKGNIIMDHHPEIQKRVNEYQNDLLIYAYQKALIESKLDTSVTDELLQSFYDKFKENFPLAELTLNASCIAVNKDAPKIDSVKIWMRLPRSKYAKRIEKYALQYAHFFSFDSTLWFEYSDIQDKMPAIRIYKPASTLTYRKYFEREDSVNRYFLKVHQYHLSGAPAPMAMIENKLKHIILNRRRTKFIEDLNEDLYLKAYKGGQFEIINQEDEK